MNKYQIKKIARKVIAEKNWKKELNDFINKQNLQKEKIKIKIDVLGPKEKEYYEELIKLTEDFFKKNENYFKEYLKKIEKLPEDQKIFIKELLKK